MAPGEEKRPDLVFHFFPSFGFGWSDEGFHALPLPLASCGNRFHLDKPMVLACCLSLKTEAIHTACLVLSRISLEVFRAVVLCLLLKLVPFKTVIVESFSL